MNAILRNMKFEDECFQFGEDFYPAGVEWENCDIVPADPGVESVYYEFVCYDLEQVCAGNNEEPPEFERCNEVVEGGSLEFEYLDTVDATLEQLHEDLEQCCTGREFGEMYIQVPVKLLQMIRDNN